jgi:hypothetical protein
MNELLTYAIMLDSLIVVYLQFVIMLTLCGLVIFFSKFFTDH